MDKLLPSCLSVESLLSLVGGHSVALMVCGHEDVEDVSNAYQAQNRTGRILSDLGELSYEECSGD